MASRRDNERGAARSPGEIVITALGIALVAAAVAANQAWLDRHFMPSFLLPRPWYVRIETAVRVVIAAAGLLIAAAATRRRGQAGARRGAGWLPIVIAAALAFAAGELVLRRSHFRPVGWVLAEEEPRRQFDARLGWTFVPSRAARTTIAGRTVEYAFDAHAYRVRRMDEAVDPTRPAVLFVGESVMFGEGLTFDESIPAQTGVMLHVQSANLAVHGFGTDQSYLRLESELPRFRQPLAVVALFMTTLFGRNLDDDRPHLGPGLVWLPERPYWRLAALARLLVPYRSDRTVERGMVVTREALAGIVKLARERGATPLIVVPQFGVEEAMERTLRRRILDEPGLPYVLVPLDLAWRLPWDRHPDAHAALVVATAIAEALGRRGQAGQVGQAGRVGQVGRVGQALRLAALAQGSSP